MHNSTKNIRIKVISNNLIDIEANCWERLVEGAQRSRSAFHLPTIANIDEGQVNIRTVILRKALPEERELRFHTDIRSPKWTEIRKNPHVGLVFYHPEDRIQVRIKGKARLHSNDLITKEAWEKTTLSSRKCYLTDFSPSSQVAEPTSGLASHIEHEQFSVQESEVGYVNFGIVSIRVDSIDWLWLHHAGHRRAFFDYQKGEKSWMIP
jgi:3-hydroxyisobutyrate dehydrogenase